MQLMRALALVAAALPAVAAADGTISVRGAYYKERSTRVVQPMIDAVLAAGPNGLVTGHFLVDSITSASAATGAGPVEFTELRYELGVGYLHEFAPVRVGLDGRYSTESDYDSFYVSGRAELDLAEKRTMLRLRVAQGFDAISNGVEVDRGAVGTPRRDEDLATTLASFGWQQIVRERVVTNLTYDLLHARGYQANIYRVVFGGDEPVPERVPDARWRHALAASARWHLPSETTLVGLARLYRDDWGVTALTPEVRATQRIRDGLDVRVRYRLHLQSAADFYEDVYTAAQIADEMQYVTDDEKLGAFTTHTVGAQLVVTLERLGVRGSWGQAHLDLMAERIWQSTSFGAAWVAQVGLSLPLTY